MSLWESLVTALKTLISNKMRSALTILGVIIGVSAVVFLISFGKGHAENISSIFQSMGANSLYVTGSTSITEQSFLETSGATGSLTVEDAEALVDPGRAPSVAMVAPVIQKSITVIYRDQNIVTTIIGSTPNVQFVMDYPVAEGTFFSETDLKRNASVALLGSTTASRLFGAISPIGETIRVSGRNFEVIGVLQKKGALMFTMDELVMIPLTTMQAKILGENTARGQSVQTIVVKVTRTDELNAAQEQIDAILRQRHRIKTGRDADFSIINMQEILESMKKVMIILQVFLGSVGGVSLFVGGIGIMNIMLVSVTERTREIGIRRAVGAKRRDVVRQFLVEAALLSLTGGVIGLAIALMITRAITGINLEGYAVKAPVTPDTIALALGVAIFTGLASGLYPAFRAARLDPIQSLRHE